MPEAVRKNERKTSWLYNSVCSGDLEHWNNRLVGGTNVSAKLNIVPEGQDHLREWDTLY